MGDKVIRIIVTAATGGSNQALKQLAASMGLLSQSTKKLSSDFGSLRNGLNSVLGASFLGFGIREIANLSDSMQTLNDRITVLSGGSEQAKSVMKGLLATANNTKTSIDGLATVYSRLAASTSETGVSAKTLLNITEALQNSFRLSGATTAEATAVAIQLSQGFASGAVRGQELRSVLEQNVVVAKLLRKEFGQDIFKKAEQGIITADKVMRILLNSQESLRADASKLGQTYEQSVLVAMNKIKFAILELNQEFDLSGKFAKTLDGVAERLKVIGVAIGVVAALIVGPWIAGLSAATLAIVGLTTAMGLLITQITDESVQDFFKSGFGEEDKKFVKGRKELDEYLKSVQDLKTLVKPGTGDITTSKIFDPQPIKDANGAVIDLGFSLEKTLGIMDKQIKNRNRPAILLDSTPFTEPDDLPKSRVKSFEKMDEFVRDLNLRFKAGKLDVDEYYEALRKVDMEFLNKDFESGKINLVEYNKKLKEIDMKSLENKFHEGSISVTEFQETLTRIKTDEMRKQLEAGKLSLVEFYLELGKVDDKLGVGGSIMVGTAQAIDALGTTSQAVTRITKEAFLSLEDVMFEATKSGTLNFEKFTQTILDNITRMIIQMQVLQPLMQAAMGFGSYLMTPSTATPGVGSTIATGAPVAMKGGMGGGGFSFASSGVPLTSTTGGYMSPQAGTQVNIINNADTEITTQSSTGPGGENILDVLISSKVKEGFASGAFDKTMQSSYGIKRKGF